MPSRRGWGAACAACGAALLAAEAASLALRPRGGDPTGAPVAARSYFSEQQIERARDFAHGQLAISIAVLVVQGVVLVALVRRPGRALPGRGAFVTGAAIWAVLALAPLPLSVVARERAKDVGLVTQGWGGYASDVVKSTAIGALIAGAGAALAVVLMRRFGPRWWLPGSAVVVLAGAGFLLAGPVVLDPLFNRFEPLPPGRTRSDVLALARQADVRVDRVLVVDASRRSTAANAYVTGLGASKRVVLYDTLLHGFTRDEVRLVVAHELGHVRFHDVPRGLLYLALVAPFGMLGVARLTRRLAGEDAHGTATALPALALSLAVVGLPMLWISNGLSRRVEARADRFSLQVTHAPAPFVSFQRRLAIRNVTDPDPPAWAHALFGTHPTTLQRIGMADQPNG